MKLHSAFITISSLFFLVIHGMERSYSLDPSKIKNVREGTQLLYEKVGELKTNQKLNTGHLSQKVDGVTKSVKGVDTKVQRLSDTVEDSSEIAKHTIKNIDERLTVLLENVLLLKEQTNAIQGQIKEVSTDLTAVKAFVTPLSMATANPAIQNAVASPRETIPLGGSPRKPEVKPFEKPSINRSGLITADKTSTKKKKKKSPRNKKTSQS